MVRRTRLLLVLALALGGCAPLASAFAQTAPCDRDAGGGGVTTALAAARQQPPEEPPPDQTETVPVPVPPGEQPGADRPDGSPRTGGDVLPLSAAGLLLLGLGAWLRRTAHRPLSGPEPGSVGGG